MVVETGKVVCQTCGWQGREDEIDVVQDPKVDGNSWAICPECRSADDIEEACDEPGCWSCTTCGTPTPEGYRRTCGKHCPPWPR